MSRASLSFALGLVLAVALVAAAFARGGAEAGGDSRLVFLYVTGQTSQVKAHYSGGPPSGVPLQDALDTFSAQGFKFAAIASSGTPTGGAGSTVASTDSRSAADYVIILQR